MMLIQEGISDVVSRMRPVGENKPPYFMYGKRKFINEMLKSKSQSVIAKYHKYPLIALRFDNDEDIFESQQFDLNIVIATLTKPTYTLEQRMELVIKPILIPLYNQFMEELSNVSLFMWPYEGTENGLAPHVRTIRPFWGAGGLEENETNVFADPLDAIEIKNLRINSINC